MKTIKAVRGLLIFLCFLVMTGICFESKGISNILYASHSQSPGKDKRMKMMWKKFDALLVKGKTQEAILEANRLINMFPGYANGYNSRATAYWVQEKYNQALLDLNKAISLDPGETAFYKNRGLLYLKTNKINQAISDFETIVQLTPQKPDGYDGLGNAYKNKRLYEKAIFYFNKAIDLAAEDHNYLRSRAQVYAYQGKFDLALADINKSIQGNSKEYHYYSDRAYYYCMMGNYDKAIIDANKVIMLNPKHAEAFSTRGIAHWMKKIKDQAIEDMKSAIELVPDVSIRCAFLGYFMHEQGQGAKAGTYFLRAIRLDPNIIEYISKVGQLADAASIQDFYERVGTTAKIYKQKTPPARDYEMREEQVTGQDYVPIETSVLIESVKIIPGSVLPGGDFQIKVKCLVRDPGLEEKQVNIKFRYKIMKDEKSISGKTQDLSVPVGKPAILKCTLVAGKTPGVYNIQVMIFYKKKIAGDSASLEIK